MRLIILSRASELARIQAHTVKCAIEAMTPGATITLLTRDAAGDVDRVTPLWQLGDKGAFTSDLSESLARGDADIVVHSWKDLPADEHPHTVVAATLRREDPRDVLLVRRETAAARPHWLRVLSSSPRRAYMLGECLPGFLPWRIETVECLAVRGNVPTRIEKLVRGEGDALVVAKAALDRLLDPASPFPETAARLRALLARCRWTVLPIREHPAAPAQGALALEIRRRDIELARALNALNHEPTWRAVRKERDILSRYGGGCAQAIGATVMDIRHGELVSVRGRTPQGVGLDEWTLTSQTPVLPKTSLAAVWPRPDERDRGSRHAFDVAQPGDDRGLYVTRAEALPAAWTVGPNRIVWAAGSATWRKLAARGVWVHGSTEGLGGFDPHAIDRLTGRTMTWHRLTHHCADVPDALPTYRTDISFPDDVTSRTHFFWRSSFEYRKAIEAHPVIRDAWHGAGPGHTFDVVERLSGPRRVRVALDYESWLKEVTE